MLEKVSNRILNTFRSCAWKAWNWKCRFLLGRLGLSQTLTTGIRIDISSMADWTLYNDIFVSGEYDLAIHSALAASTGTCNVLDLGANVGLFAKRALHIRREAFPDVAMDIACIEGLPRTYEELKRLFPEPTPKESARLLHGLAGSRDGSAVLEANVFHAMTGLSRRSRARSGIEVDFLDLSGVTESWDNIDLLKCDIEGAEQLFIESYPDLLRRTTLAVFEFHLDRVEHAKCVADLAACGLDRRNVLHSNEHISVEIFRRL